MISLEDVFSRSPPPKSRHWTRLIILLIMILLVWAFYVEFDEVAVKIRTELEKADREQLYEQWMAELKEKYPLERFDK